jgi:ElaB/YqjD/DUF883 family membrane-anchored ribosome-binding protein
MYRIDDLLRQVVTAGFRGVSKLSPDDIQTLSNAANDVNTAQGELEAVWQKSGPSDPDALSAALSELERALEALRGSLDKLLVAGEVAEDECERLRAAMTEQFSKMTGTYRQALERSSSRKTGGASGA